MSHKSRAICYVRFTSKLTLHMIICSHASVAAMVFTGSSRQWIPSPRLIRSKSCTPYHLPTYSYRRFTPCLLLTDLPHKRTTFLNTYCRQTFSPHHSSLTDLKA